MWIPTTLVLLLLILVDKPGLQASKLSKCQSELQSAKQTLASMGYRADLNYFPQPARASPLPYTPAEGFRGDLRVWFRQIGTTNVWWLTEGVYQASIVVGTSQIVILDCPPSITSPLITLAKELNKTVSHIVYSHSHTDHIAGCGQVKQAFPSAQIVSTQAINQVLVDLYSHGASTETRPVPTKTFTKNYTIPLVGNPIQLFEVPHSAHDNGELLAFMPNAKVMFYIDVVFPFQHPFHNWAISDNLMGFASIWEYILGFNGGDWTHIITGHMFNIGTKAEVLEQAELLQDTLTFMAEEMEKIDFAALGAKLYPRIFAIFQKGIADAAIQCSNRLMAKWKNLLGGMDTFAYSSCWQARHFQDDYIGMAYHVPTGTMGRRLMDAGKKMSAANAFVKKAGGSVVNNHALYLGD